MKVLVTGAAGRIGGAICARLQLEGHQVLGLDRLPSPHTTLVGDITHLEPLRTALEGVEAIVHSAALHAPHVASLPEDDFERINVRATHELAALAARLGAQRFVFTSTTALYGAAPSAQGHAAWVDEATAPRPRTIYHRSKLAAEQCLREAAVGHGLAVTVLRMSRCFPEPAALMAAYRLYRGVDARDVASAHALALAHTQAGLRTYVVSGATPFLPQDTAELGRDAPAVLRRRAPALVQAFSQRGWPLPRQIDRVYSPALALRELGWRPQYGFAEVLSQLDAGSPEVSPA
jgi:nucleoside-diphosphate-sugar epimerase